MEKHSQLRLALDLLYRQGLTAAYCWVIDPMQQSSSAADEAGASY